MCLTYFRHCHEGISEFVERFEGVEYSRHEDAGQVDAGHDAAWHEHVTENLFKYWIGELY